MHHTSHIKFYYYYSSIILMVHLEAQIRNYGKSIIHTFLEPANQCEFIAPLMTSTGAHVIELLSNLMERYGQFWNCGKSTSFKRDFLIHTFLEPATQCEFVAPSMKSTGARIIELQSNLMVI
jgi:hypothetical protein